MAREAQVTRRIHTLGHDRPGTLRPATDAERVQGQIERGEVRAGPDAAREIAARIEADGGFWNHPDHT